MTATGIIANRVLLPVLVSPDITNPGFLSSCPWRYGAKQDWCYVKTWTLQIL